MKRMRKNYNLELTIFAFFFPLLTKSRKHQVLKWKSFESWFKVHNKNVRKKLPTFRITLALTNGCSDFRRSEEYMHSGFYARSDHIYKTLCSLAGLIPLTAWIHANVHTTIVACYKSVWTAFLYFICGEISRTTKLFHDELRQDNWS